MIKKHLGVALIATIILSFLAFFFTNTMIFYYSKFTHPSDIKIDGTCFSLDKNFSIYSSESEGKYALYFSKRFNTNEIVFVEAISKDFFKKINTNKAFKKVYSDQDIHTYKFLGKINRLNYITIIQGVNLKITSESKFNETDIKKGFKKIDCN